MSFIEFFDGFLSLLFLLCYSYQFFYIAVSLFSKYIGKAPATQDKKAEPFRRYAVLICARNEEEVIGRLVDSVKNQSWPQNLVKTFVMADNCRDNTALLAKKAGAAVYERFDTRLVGKGYALDALIKNIWRDYGSDAFDGYFVFDADNILSPDYIRNMDRTFAMGYPVVTSCRNSKNLGENWISAGYGLWFCARASI